MTRRTLTALLLALSLHATSASAGTATELYQQSFTLENAGSYADALSRMDDLMAQGVDDYLLHLRRGWLLYLNGRYVDAVDAYKVASERAPRSVEAQLGMTLPLLALRRWTDAEVACRTVLNMAPGNYTAMGRLAYVLFSGGKYAEAEQAYRAVVEQYPGDSDLRAGLGWALLRLGRGEEARAEFQKVLDVVPGHASAGEGMAALN